MTARWILFVGKRARIILAMIGLAALAAGLYLGLQASTRGPEELLRLSTQRDMAALRREFPYPDDMMLLVRGGAPETRRQFLDELERQLASHPQTFPDRLYKLDAEPVGSRLLLYLAPEQLENLAATLEGLRPRLLSGANLVTWLQPEPQSSAKPGGDVEALGKLYQRNLVTALKSSGRAAWKSPLESALTRQQVELIRPYWEGQQEIYLELDDGRTNLFFIRPGHDQEAAMQQLRAILFDLRQRNPDVETELTGSLAVASEQTGALLRELGRAALFLGFLVLVGLLSGALRPARLASGALSLALAALCSAGWGAWLLDLGPIWLTAQTFVLFLAGYLVLHYGVAGDLVHLGRVGLVAVAAFLALTASSIGPIASLGLACASGMLIACAVLMAAIPAWEALGLRPATREESPVLWHGWPGRGATRAILALTAALALFCLSRLETTRFSSDPLAAADPDAPSLRTEREMKGQGGTTLFAMVLLPDIQTAHRACLELQRRSCVREVFSLALLVPEEAPLKAPWIDRIARIARQARPPAPIPLASAADLEALAERIPAGKEDGSDLGKLVARMGPGEIQDALQSYQKHLLDEYRRLFQLLASQRSQPLRGEELPPGVRQRLVGQSGKIAVLVFPHLGGSDTLERFASELRHLVPRFQGRLGGPGVLAAELGGLTRRAVAFMPWALGCGLLIGLTIVFRSPGKALLVGLGPALGWLFTSACLEAYAIPLNFLTWPGPVVVLLQGTSLAMGALRPRASLTALFPAVVVLLASLSLLPCGHPGLAGLGLVIGLGTAFNLLVAVVVLPAALTFGRAVLRRRS